MLEVAQSADVIISSSLVRPLALAVGKRVRVPVGIVHLQPLARTKFFLTTLTPVQALNLIPTTPDVGNNVYLCGPLADQHIPPDWSPPVQLERFLQDSEQMPVCVGYGSMPFSRVEAVLDALRTTRSRAVLVGPALKLTEDDWTREHVIHVTSVPYGWLLPRCSIMLNHGVAGVVNSALRAGVPYVVSPLMGDQPFGLLSWRPGVLVFRQALLSQM
ncbi:MAG: hypothetical protein SGPRY_011423 [Prymnesium sp.]